MPTALNRGRQAQTPSVPTLPIPNPQANAVSVAPKRPQVVHKGATRPSKSEASTSYGLDYFHNRLKALGLTRDEAKDYGLDVDAQGNILQLVRRFDGSFIQFIPHKFRKKVERILNHRSSYQPHLDMYYRLLAVTRYHPDYLKANPKRSKYGNEYGERVHPLPAPLAIKAYQENTTGGTITFIEGYFKAVALDRAGVESVAFTGITLYKIYPELREYLLRRRPYRIFIMYDADALDVSSSSHRSPGGALTVARGGGQDQRSCRNPSSSLSSNRNENFANSARTFATALFSLFSSIEHTCEIIFVMGKPSPPLGAGGPKGLDDLIEAYGAEPVTKDLLNFNFTPTFRQSKFFAGFTLAKSTCNRKINRLFLGDNYRHWFERLTAQPPAKASSTSVREGLAPSQRAKRAENSGSLKAKRLSPKSSAAASIESSTFVYRNATYQPISTGNLYDETITYQLNTNPFAVDVATDHLVIKQYLTDQSKTLINLINDKQRLAIQAPTGSGKTTFLIKFAKRQKTHMVIAMPTINLAEQTARGTGGFVLTGERNTAKIRAANEKNLVICTYDTLHQVPDLWRRILVIDEAHNLINQYGQVYNGFNPFRADTLRNCVRLFPEAKKTILLSGTMPPLLCHAFDFHLATFRRLENPTVRVFDIEANGSDNAALAKCLITRLAEVFPSRAKRAATSPLSPGEGSGERSRAKRAENNGSLKAQRLNPKRSGATSKQGVFNELCLYKNTDITVCPRRNHHGRRPRSLSITPNISSKS